ncbi:MAG: glutamate--cysteine ligase [Streptosporangiales bacterium]|nr:glutamate--cysteine ligase [Streptosporangiales bacterium]
MVRLTVGVEEEFLLVDAVTARPAPRADEVLAAARPCRHGAVLKRELQRSQVEVASPVCATLAELRTCLAEARAVLAGAAASVGLRALPAGCPPYAGPPVGCHDGERFRRIEATHAGVVRDYQACGCHVHVGVADRDLAVRALPHLRPWLATLLAASANSPYADGRDTGFASWRTVLQSRFPGSGPVPADVATAYEYDRLVDRLVACGALVDRQMSFWLARPSEHLPTVELRVADTGLTVDDAVLQAGLTRALVATALAAVADARAAPPVPDALVTTAVWRASRYGLGGDAVDARTGRLVPAVDAVGRLLEHVAAGLRRHDDAAVVRRLLVRTLTDGDGAARQRRTGIAEPGAYLSAFTTAASSFDRQPAG